MLDRTEWLTRVISLANIVLDLHGSEIAASRNKAWYEDYILNKVESYLRSSNLMVEDHLDYIRHSACSDLSPELWQEAESWQSVVYNVAFRCISHDVRAMVIQILDGRAPRRSNPLNTTETARNGDKD